MQEILGHLPYFCSVINQNIFFLCSFCKSSSNEYHIFLLSSRLDRPDDVDDDDDEDDDDDLVFYISFNSISIMSRPWKGSAMASHHLELNSTFRGI